MLLKTISGYTDKKLTKSVDVLYHENCMIKQYGTDTAKKSFGPWAHRNITCRLGHLASALVCPLSRSADLILGTITFIGSLVTFRYFDSLNTYSSKLLESGNLVFSKTFVNLLKTVNPNVKIKDCDAMGGSATFRVAEKIFNRIMEMAKSDNFFVKHILSRITALSIIPICLITLVSETALSVIFAGASLITFGYFDTINDLAILTLPKPPLIALELVGLPIIAVELVRLPISAALYVIEPPLPIK